MALTDSFCKNAQAKAKPYREFDGGGLYLQITTAGAKYWRLKYRYLDKEKCLALGIYPQVSLKEARAMRELAKKQLSNGIDPSQERKKEKRQKVREAENSFKAVAVEWHNLNLENWTPNHAAYTLRRMEQNLFPYIGNQPINTIEPPDLLETLRKIEERGASDMAGRIRSICGQVFRYAVATGRATRNPAADLVGALKPYKKGHFASIEINEIPEFIQALEGNKARLYRHTQLAAKMLMLTLVRTSELIEATWGEFDLENAQWVIPAERMKMRQQHIVPLSSQVLAILAELKALSPNSDYIFPSQFGHKKHMSNNTVLKGLERLGYKGRMTGHGFRSLGLSAIKEKLSYRHEVVDRQLAHAPKSKVDRAYDRAKFLDERKIMMQDWANYLDEVQHSASKSNLKAVSHA
jgi:integrase